MTRSARAAESERAAARASRRSARPLALVVTCEHASARVPARYAARFAGAERVLASHRGHDAGALELARELARAFDAPLHATTVSRLVVDANRSADHARVFSPYTRELPDVERERLLARYWRPHRERVEAEIAARIAGGARVLHLGVHSFTPRLKGVVRTVDVGVLYDPARALERAVADRWLAELGPREPRLRLARNRPYRGTADGLTTALRPRFPAARYAGLELEVSQRFPRGDSARWRRLRRALAESLAATLAGLGG